MLNSRRLLGLSAGQRQGMRGVTLIELMVVLAIFGIIMSIAVPAWSTYLDRVGVHEMANQVRSDILLAQAEALQKQTPYCVHYTASSNSYEIVPLYFDSSHNLKTLSNSSSLIMRPIKTCQVNRDVNFGSSDWWLTLGTRGWVETDSTYTTGLSNVNNSYSFNVGGNEALTLTVRVRLNGKVDIE